MELTTVWFAVIAFLWTGYFVLEGFDFGVGVLLPLIGRGRDAEARRRTMLTTIGPVWDGNEVWLIVAAGAMFAAFPDWYATVFSGFYLPMLAILVALILRGLAIEYRGKRDDAAWRRRWDAAIFWGSLVPAVLWGMVFGNIAGGVPVDAAHEYAGGLADLVTPYALLGGATTLALFVTHGAVFLGLKTRDDVRASARRVAIWAGCAAAAAGTAFVTWTLLRHPDPVAIGLAAVAVAGLTAGLAASRVGRDGWAFAGTAVATGLVFVVLFWSLFPDVLPSTINPAYALTTTNAASSPYALRVMSWLAAVFTPLVLLYQGWTYWVFRRRVSTRDLAEPPRPVAAPHG
ncbi:MAG TPA: cytochrome d ubiquinol oxidase subunit II [Streptosporangiaceae bacterium]|jgi:cytochrome d ubiquinol oxidase subunit II